MMDEQVTMLLDEIKRLYREKMENLSRELMLLANEPQRHWFGGKTTYKVELTFSEWQALWKRYLADEDRASITSVEHTRRILTDMAIQAIEAEQRREQKVYQEAWNKLYNVVNSASVDNSVWEVEGLRGRMDEILTECKNENKAIVEEGG